MRFEERMRRIAFLQREEEAKKKLAEESSAPPQEEVTTPVLEPEQTPVEESVEPAVESLPTTPIMGATLPTADVSDVVEAVAPTEGATVDKAAKKKKVK